MAILLEDRIITRSYLDTILVPTDTIGKQEEKHDITVRPYWKNLGGEVYLMYQILITEPRLTLLDTLPKKLKAPMRHPITSTVMEWQSNRNTIVPPSNPG